MARQYSRLSLPWPAPIRRRPQGRARGPAEPLGPWLSPRQATLQKKWRLRPETSRYRFRGPPRPISNLDPSCCFAPAQATFPDGGTGWTRGPRPVPVRGGPKTTPAAARHASSSMTHPPFGERRSPLGLRNPSSLKTVPGRGRLMRAGRRCRSPSSTTRSPSTPPRPRPRVASSSGRSADGSGRGALKTLW